MNTKIRLLNAALALGLGLIMAACGGGGSGGEGSGAASVSTMSASPTRYGQTMTINVTGRNLDQGIDMVVEGNCQNLTRVAGGTADGVQFTCIVRGIGEIVPRVRAFDGQRELASLKVSIPLPRVSLTLSDGSRSGAVLLELDPVAAPNTVDNFLAYATTPATAPFYRGTAVSYADPAMGIRLGGFTLHSSGSGALTAKTPTRDPIPVEAGNGLKNLRGTVALVARQVGDPAVQWWISTKDNPTLDLGSAENPAGYTVFGKVVEGLEIVEVATAVPTLVELVSGSTRAPVTGVTISAISQTR